MLPKFTMQISWSDVSERSERLPEEDSEKVVRGAE